MNVKQLQLHYTHFYSLPIKFSDGSVFEDFKNAALATIRDSRLEEMFAYKCKLHLTVSTLILNDNHKKYIATTIVNRILRGPFELNFSNIGFFGDDDEHVKVIYASPDPSSILDEISQFLLLESQNAGICDSLSTVWHCTLINTR